MSIATVGVGVLVGAAGAGVNYALAQSNKPKAYNPAANNWLGMQNLIATQDRTKQYQAQVSGYGDTFGKQVAGLTKTYGNQGTGASQNYLTNTGNALSSYGNDIQALAKAAPLNEFNAAQAGINFNAANLGNYSGIADYLSQNAQASQLGLINNSMPTWQKQYAQGMSDASQMQQGLISADVQGNLGRSAAFKALGSGVGGGGSGLGRNLAARDLGLTSLDLQKQGNALTQSLGQQQYGMTVAGMLTNPNAIYQANGINSGQAMNAGALGTNIAATGLQTGLAGQLSTQGTNFGQLMGMYGNQYTTGVSADQSIMNMQAAAALQAMSADTGAITGNYQNQMNGNLMQFQQDQAIRNYNNAANQQLVSGITSAVGGAASGFMSNGGMNYLSGLGNGGLQSNGFYNSAGAAQDMFGAGSHIASFKQDGGGLGYYNQGYW